ncbi:hypothetical protein BIW11_09843 [Tropilaelaps mercedesae]|uniref:Uncharacterized protein n=1 Tax=Tropilaelaps mercedesae TaxID=418985 RepID=A0A1V9XIT4_9ACAR|nr:hypothetical protein BIW11_09843 [Tropilaelaps mercedesae]
MDDELTRLAESLRLPLDVLRLSDGGGGGAARSSGGQPDQAGLLGTGVCLVCRIGLERGTLFGPFRASLRSVGSGENNNKKRKPINREGATSPQLSSLAESPCDIEVMVSGALNVLRLEDEAGAWLRCICLRPENDDADEASPGEVQKQQLDGTTNSDDSTAGCGSSGVGDPGANCLILYQEGEVCLTLTADVAQDEALVADFRVAFSDMAIKVEEAEGPDVDVADSQDQPDESGRVGGENITATIRDLADIKESPPR